MKQVHDLIITHLVRRKVDPLCLIKEKKEKAANNKIRQIYKLVEGIDQIIAKKIVSDVKKSKIKVQIKINGNELRVDGINKAIYADNAKNRTELLLESETILTDLNTE